MKFDDYKKIEKLLNDYFEAVSEANIDKLKSIFHEQASMYGYLENNLVVGTPQIFYDDLQSKPSMKSSKIDCKMVIQNINVADSVATASLYVDNFFGAFRINDYFHLLKIDSEWKILCKTFTTIK